VRFGIAREDPFILITFVIFLVFIVYSDLKPERITFVKLNPRSHFAVETDNVFIKICIINTVSNKIFNRFVVYNRKRIYLESCVSYKIITLSGGVRSRILSAYSWYLFIPSYARFRISTLQIYPPLRHRAIVDRPVALVTTTRYKCRMVSTPVPNIRYSRER